MMEMTSCCDLQLDILRENLTVESLKALPVGESLGHDCAAPRDETLFDTVELFLCRPEGALLEITGRVGYWSPVSGYSSKEAPVRRFGSEEACLGWLEGDDADKECAGVLFAWCRAD